MKNSKFRAFDKKRNEYVYFDFELLNSESKTFYLEQIKGNDIEEATGKKIKNIDTYEGDIFRTGNTKKEYKYYIIQWSDYHSAYIAKDINNKKNDMYVRFLVYEKNIINIGNINQNPELLEKYK